MTALNPEPIQEKKQETKEVIQNPTSVEANIPQKETENQSIQDQENPNWTAFREGRKKDRLEKEAAERRASEKEAEVAALKAAMEAAFSKSSPTPQAYQQYYGMNQSDTEETDEQRLEKKINHIIAQKEQQYEKERSEREMREYPNRLSKDLSDFNNVCSQENLDYLDFHYPEISRPFQRLPDGYDKWRDIYHAVKKLIPNHSTAKKDAIRAEINSNKPKSISSQGPSPTGNRALDTWQEVDKRRAENWARMERIRKGVG